MSSQEHQRATVSPEAALTEPGSKTLDFGSNRARLEALGLAQSPEDVGPLPAWARQMDGTPPEPWVVGHQVEKGQGVEHVATLYFDTDSAHVHGGQRVALAALAALYTQERPWAHFEVQVEGFCDERGSEAHNAGLSAARAAAVEDAIRAAFASAELLVTASGKGELPGADRGDRREARRVDVLLAWSDPGVEAERSEAEEDLPYFLAEAIRRAQQGDLSSEIDQRTLRLMKVLQDPEVDDRYIDEGAAMNYIMNDLYVETKAEPEEMVSHATPFAIDAARYAKGKGIEVFITHMERLGLGIFYGIEAIGRKQELDANKSAHHLNSWVGERQRDEKSVLYTTKRGG